MQNSELIKNRTMFFMPYGIKKKHFERGLENLQRVIDRGEEVGVIVCDKSLLSCFRNPNNSYFQCVNCVSRRKNGLSLINGDFKTFSLPSITNEELNRINDFLNFDIKNINDLKKIYFDDFDIGFAVASTIITLNSNPNPDLGECKNLVNDLLWSSARVYLSVKKLLKENKPSKLYFHNGRHALGRAVLRLSESFKIDYCSYEAGFKIDEFILYENGMPQDRGLREKQIRTHWANNKNYNQKYNAAESYFMKQKSGENAKTIRFNYVRNQNQDKLPQNWNSEKKNIVIYNTTENEYAAIDDSFSLPFYSSQLNGIKEIAKSLEINKKTHHLYLRIHPNYAQNNDPAVKDFLALNYPNLTIIKPDSDISTYKLMLEADKNITFFSSVGPESVFLGKPTILLGQAAYKELGGFYIPKTHNECIDLITKTLKPLDRKGAIMWGYYHSTYGTKYKYYKPVDNMNGKFKGKIVSSSYFAKKLKSRLFKKYLFPLESLISYVYRFIVKSTL